MILEIAFCLTGGKKYDLDRIHDRLCDSHIQRQLVSDQELMRYISNVIESNPEKECESAYLLFVAGIQGFIFNFPQEPLIDEIINDTVAKHVAGFLKTHENWKWIANSPLLGKIKTYL